MLIVGTLRNSKYDKKGKKHASTEIVVKEIHFTGSKKKSKPDESHNNNKDVFAEEDTAF